jgi:hypothetical protein
VTAPELLLYLHATLQPFVVAAVREKEHQKRVKGGSKANIYDRIIISSKMMMTKMIMV